MLTINGEISWLVASLDGKKIALTRRIQGDRIDIEIYSFDEKEKIEYTLSAEMNEFAQVYKLEFSEDSKYLIAACRGKIIIFSALTKEVIGELNSTEQQAFQDNYSGALSSDNNTLIIGSLASKTLTQEYLTGGASNNILMWDFIPKKHLPAWKKLQNVPPLFKNIYPIISWYYQSQNGTIPVKLSLSEKDTFHRFDYDLQQLLTDVGIIAPGQLSKKTQTLLEKTPFQSEQSNMRNQEQSQETIFQKIMRATGTMAKDFINYIAKMSNALPGSG